MKKTKQQMCEAICRWSAYLIENNLATDAEVQSVLNEGLFKRAKTFIKNKASGAAKAVADAVKATGKAIHDTFAANDGVKQLVTQISKLRKDDVAPADIKFYVFDGKNTYAVQKFVLSKNRKALAALYDEQKKKADPCSYEDFNKLMADSKIIDAGKKHKITDFVNSLLIGQIVDEPEIFSEAEINEAGKFDRLDDVIAAMKWKEKTALDPDNIQKLVVLFGITDKKAIRDRVKAYFSTKGSDAGDSSSSDAGSESGSDDFSKDDEPTEDAKPAKDTESVNDYAIKTTDGDEVGIIDAPFKAVKTKGKNIGLIFGLGKKAQQRKDDIDASLS